MKPTEIKKSILLLSKKSIVNLTLAEMGIVNGGLITKPNTIIVLPDTTPIETSFRCETLIGCPCTI